MVVSENSNQSSTTMTSTTVINIVVALGTLLLLITADNGDVVAADGEALAVPAHARARSGCNTLDEAIGVVPELALASLVRGYVASPNGDEGPNGDRRACADVKALRHGRAVIVKKDVARGGERGRGQRRR